MKKVVKNTVVGGAGLMLGGVTLGAFGGISSHPSVGKVSSTAGSALEIGSVGLVIGASKGVMDSFTKLSPKKKRK